MSGRSKAVFYRIFLIVIGLLAIVGTVIVASRSIEISKTQPSYYWAFGLALLLLVLLPVHTLVHELGHLLVGLTVGLKFASMRLGALQIYKVGKRIRLRFLLKKEVAGSCEMYPSREKGVKGKLIALSLGGILFNFIYGGVFLAFFFLLKNHPVLYFFELFAPLSLFEGLAALYPLQTATGKTDGETVRALVKGEPSAVVALRVLTAQGILFRQTYGELSEELLYDVPVVREDDEAFPALLQLRWGYRLYRGEEELAIRAAERIESLYDELPYTSRCDIACDLVYTRCVLKGDTEGVEAYVEDITDAYGQPSYFRAKAAYYRAIGDEVEYRQALEQALSAADNAPIYGLKMLEEKLLERIAQE